MDINLITVSYELHGVRTTLELLNDFQDCDRIIRNLPALFARIIRDMGANPSLVVEELKSEFYHDLKDDEE